MNTDTTIIILAKLYKLLEKFNFSDNHNLDFYLDNHYPEVVAKLQTLATNEKYVFCGTNGKKTSLDIFNQILNAHKNTFITNITKSAKKYPILTSIILELNNNFDCNKDYYTMILNDDELSNYFSIMKFDCLVLLNLFDDQKDFSSLEDKKKKIQNAIILNSKLDLIINADEPMFYQIDKIKNDTTFNKQRRKIYYGFDKIEVYDDNKDLIQKNDITKCPVCGCSLEYEKRYYSHIGHYFCECGFKRPNLDIRGEAKIFSDYTFLTVNWGQDNKYVFKLPFGGVYNAYNALAAISCAINLKIDRKTITQAFENYKHIKSRDEIIIFRNKEIKIKTIKNPVSLSEAVKELYGEKNSKIVFCLNDYDEDGLDTSWIWDANLESLQGFENKIYVCGTRFDDMALRLKYSKINPSLIIMDANIKSASECCFYELEEKEKMIVFAVPSALKKVRSVFKK